MISPQFSEHGTSALLFATFRRGFSAPPSGEPISQGRSLVNVLDRTAEISLFSTLGNATEASRNQRIERVSRATPERRRFASGQCALYRGRGSMTRARTVVYRTRCTSDMEICKNLTLACGPRSDKNASDALGKVDEVVGAWPEAHCGW